MRREVNAPISVNVPSSNREEIRSLAVRQPFFAGFDSKSCSRRAFAVLFSTMFAKEVLDMSFFPTMLLFTTVFRIGLNTSSTRLILTTGNPGNVVATFGSFVGSGNLIVGVIIFIITTI